MESFAGDISTSMVIERLRILRSLVDRKPREPMSQIPQPQRLVGIESDNCYAHERALRACLKMFTLRRASRTDAVMRLLLSTEFISAPI